MEKKKYRCHRRADSVENSASRIMEWRAKCMHNRSADRHPLPSTSSRSPSLLLLPPFHSTVHVQVCVCVCVCVRACVRVCLYAYVYTCVFLYACVCVYAYYYVFSVRVCVCTCMSVCAHARDLHWWTFHLAVFSSFLLTTAFFSVAWNLQCLDFNVTLCLNLKWRIVLEINHRSRSNVFCFQWWFSSVLPQLDVTLGISLVQKTIKQIFSLDLKGNSKAV